jgi:hypothetical protein
MYAANLWRARHRGRFQSSGIWHCIDR